MTSSLPDFSSNSPSATVTDTASLAGLLSSTGCDAAPAAGPASEFADLLGASSAPDAAAEPPLYLVSCGSTPTRLVADPVAASPDVPAVEPAPAVRPREISRAMIEEAATFVTSLLQTLLPEVQLPQFTGVNSPGGQASTGSVPGAAVDRAPGQLVAPGLAGAQPFTVSADGAIELTLQFPPVKPLNPQSDAAPDVPVSIQAEMQLSDEPAVRLEATGFVPAAETQPPADPAGREIFAAKYRGRKDRLESAEQSGERNFVFTGDKQVKTQSPAAGIAVAKTDHIMPVAPTEEIRPARKPEAFSGLPHRVDFQVVVPPAERVTIHAAAPAQQNFAERAVETVTNLVETQFSASMQKSGCVQLRLHFGGENLSVRVELREGAVHTDFRTDSPELRSALAREWQTVAAQSPEHLLRYLEPVFSPSAPATPASAQPAPAYGRQQQAPQDQQSRPQREAWADAAHPFAHRSQLSESYIPEPAVSRGPAFLPTSLRLSVHA